MMFNREAMVTIANALNKVLTPEQKNQFFQEIASQMIDRRGYNWYCPICEVNGSELIGNEWQRLHDDDCLVTLLEGDDNQ